MNKGNQGGGSENRDKYGRDLIDRSEVALIGGDECLVFISKEHVFKDKKFYAFQHDRADELATRPTCLKTITGSLCPVSLSVYVDCAMRFCSKKKSIVSLDNLRS